MTALNIAREYADAGIPIPCDLAFDLIAAGICPDTLTTTDGGDF